MRISREDWCGSFCVQLSVHILNIIYINNANCVFDIYVQYNECSQSCGLDARRMYNRLFTLADICRRQISPTKILWIKTHRFCLSSAWQAAGRSWPLWRLQWSIDSHKMLAYNSASCRRHFCVGDKCRTVLALMETLRQKFGFPGSYSQASAGVLDGRKTKIREPPLQRSSRCVLVCVRWRCSRVVVWYGIVGFNVPLDTI